MTSYDNNGHENPSRIDAYLDAMRSPERRATLEAWLEHEPQLREELAQQEQIDGCLRRAFAAPDGQRVRESVTQAATALPRRPAVREPEPGPVAAPAAAEPIPATIDEAPAPPPRKAGASVLARLWPAARPAAAAAILVLTSGAMGWRLARMTEDPAPVQPPLPPPTVVQTASTAGPTPDLFYQRAVAGGFSPVWTCESESDFATTFRARLGEELRLADAPEGVTPVGLSEGPDPRMTTTVVMAKAEGREVMVLVDRAGVAPDYRAMMSGRCGLHLFRTQVGNLVLHEVTPLPEPKVLGLLYQPGGSASHAIESLGGYGGGCPASAAAAGLAGACPSSGKAAINAERNAVACSGAGGAACPVAGCEDAAKAGPVAMQPSCTSEAETPAMQRPRFNTPR